MLTTGDDGRMGAACDGDGAEAGQAISEHCAAGSQVRSGPGDDCLRTDPSHRGEYDVNRVSCLVQGDGRNDRDLVL